jgi:uncharacterized protein YjiS (DUF1127 family)
MDSLPTKNDAAHRSPNLADAAGATAGGRLRRGLARLFDAFAAIGKAIADYPARRRAYDELRSLSDRELADIGLTRMDIVRVFDPDFPAERTILARGTPLFRTIAGDGRGNTATPPGTRHAPPSTAGRLPQAA